MASSELNYDSFTFLKRSTDLPLLRRRRHAPSHSRQQLRAQHPILRRNEPRPRRLEPNGLGSRQDAYEQLVRFDCADGWEEGQMGRRGRYAGE